MFIYLQSKTKTIIQMKTTKQKKFSVRLNDKEYTLIREALYLWYENNNDDLKEQANTMEIITKLRTAKFK